MVREPTTIKKDLKYEWGKLRRESNSTPEEKDAAKKAINRLEQELKEVVPETKITDWEANQKSYEAKKNIHPSSENKESPKVAETAKEEFKFTELDKDMQEKVEKKTRKLFEEKIIIMRLSKLPEFASLGFDNAASFDEILSIYNQA